MGTNPAKKFFQHWKDTLIANGVYIPARLSAYVGADIDTFVAALAQVAASLNIDADGIMYVMWHESKLNPQAQSGLKPGSPFDPSRATGLLQMEPSTARGLGTSTAALFTMTGTQQMAYVKKYFAGVKKQYGPDCMPDVASIYLAVFYPYALSQPMTYILGSESSDPSEPATIAADNPAFDIGKKGYIVKADMWAFIAKNTFKPGA